MSKFRQQQHKPEAEEKKRNKQLAELRRENQQLRKKVAKLQKTLAKTLEMTVHVSDPEPEEDIASPTVDLNTCPECTQPLTLVQLPIGILKACKSCGYRKIHARNH